ncbi:MAG: helix-turn-helix transcriptional regulator [Desulfobacteraceae bacterium]|nr:helix-turn-helix transcriptional regulator [Desulfobacteraceae bacterium]
MTKVDNLFNTLDMKTLFNKKLNIENISIQLEKLGLSQSSLAKELDTPRQNISNWMQEKKFPRPSALLKLAKKLQLSFDDLVIKTDISREPVVAFRKKGNHKISGEYIEEAKDKGFLLEQLIPYLPFDELSTPPTLINPALDYKYIQTAAAQVRKAIGKKDEFKIEFNDLIDFFNQHHAVIIPVFWGDKKNHENALHIYLPQSRTTWIYLNLDSKIHDFKFWMAHELGHVKAPELQQEEAEDFADSFAGALLVNEEMAEHEYGILKTLPSNNLKIARLKEKAEELTIAPLTIYYEINKYAEYKKIPKIDLEKKRIIFKESALFCSQYNSLAEHLFDTLPPNANEYIESARKYFDSPFFDSFKMLMSQKKKTVGFLQAILNLSTPDAHALYKDLVL